MHKFLFWLRFRRDHRWARDRISAYLDGELGERGRRRMERHVDECVDCRRLAAELGRLIDVLRRLSVPAGGSDSLQIAAAVHARLTGLPGA